MTIFDAANYFLTKVDRESGDTLTHLKLQKLTYYVQAWHLAIEGEPLFPARFEAWAHGPVNPELFQEYRIYGWDSIPYPEEFDPDAISVQDKSYLDEIWNSYGHFGARYLENLTHKERPWLEARGSVPQGGSCSTRIDEGTMAEYYGSLIEDEEEE